MGPDVPVTALEILRFAQDDNQFPLPDSASRRLFPSLAVPRRPSPSLPVPHRPPAWRERVGIEPTGAATGASQRF